MRTLRLLSLVLFSALMFASCSSSMTVSTDYDRNVDFSKYKTFGIYKLNAEAQTISELNRNRIYAAIKTALTQRGLTESETPDLWVNIVAYVDSRESVSSTTTTSGMGMGMGMGGFGMGGFHRPYMWGGGPMMMTGTSVANTQYNVNTIKEGSIIVDLIDAKSNNLVWQSVGNREIDKNFGKNADEKITKYATQIFSTFPPSTIVSSKVTVK